MALSAAETPQAAFFRVGALSCVNVSSMNSMLGHTARVCADHESSCAVMSAQWTQGCRNAAAALRRTSIERFFSYRYR